MQHWQEPAGWQRSGGTLAGLSVTNSLACLALLPEVTWLSSVGPGEALLGGQPEEGWVECTLEQSLSGQQRARLSSDTLGKVMYMTVPK